MSVDEFEVVFDCVWGSEFWCGVDVVCVVVVVVESRLFHVSRWFRLCDDWV